MKKLIALGTALIFAFADQAKGQTSVNFGVKGGVNVSNFADHPGTNMDYLTGLMAGVAADISFPMLPIGIETGLYYSQKGADFTWNGNTRITRFNYLEVPVLAKISVGISGPLSVHLLAGPYAGLNISAEQEALIRGSIEIFDLSERKNSLDYGGTIGVGTSVSVLVTEIDLQARYSRGFNDIWKERGRDAFFDPKNNVFTILVGFSSNIISF